MSFWEIIIVLLVSLLVIGPKQLPKVAQKLGQFIGAMKAMFGQVSSDVSNALQLQDNELRAKEADLDYQKEDHK